MKPPAPTRRDTLWMLAATAAVGCASEPGDSRPRDEDGDGVIDDCSTLTAEQTAGPFYPGEPASRLDIRDGMPGVRVEFDLLVVTKDTCEPIVGAEVDLWGADASGRYSGYADFDTEGENFMRGQQLTDAEGVASFICILPGAYPGRSVHLHLKVRPPGGGELTTQAYFPDAIVGEALQESAYGDSARQVTLARDGFYIGDTLATVEGDVTSGLICTLAVVV